jgi:hypothetical protein
VRRFEIARAIGSVNAGLFNNDDNTPGPTTGFPLLTSRLFFDAIEPALGARARDALRAGGQGHAAGLILAVEPGPAKRRNGVTRSTRHPAPSNRLPTDQHTHEREGTPRGKACGS